jgi:hypothetical protein
MKLYKRILLVIPFLSLTVYYAKHKLRTEGCDGFVEFFMYLILSFLIFFSLILCLIAIKRKRKKPEIITLSITIITALGLIVVFIWGDKIHGHVWIKAQNINNRHEISRQRIMLRSNNTFRYDLIEADYSCFASGSYDIKGDTLNLDKETIQDSDGKFTTRYLLTKNFLIPIIDNDNLIYDSLRIER